MNLQKELKNIKEIIENLDYNILLKEKQKQIKSFFKDVDNFSEDFISNMPDKEQIKAIEYFYYEIGFINLQKENPYLLSNFKIFTISGYSQFNTKIASLLKSLITESDLSENIKKLNKQYVNEIIDCVISSYIQRLESIINLNDLHYYGFDSDIESFIRSRTIQQHKMIWLYNMYTNMQYVYAEKIYKIYEYSWSNELEEETQEEILLDQNKDKEILLEEAEYELSNMVNNTFWNIFKIIETNFKQKYSEVEVLYKELTNKGSDFNNIFKNNIEGEYNNKSILTEWLRAEFGIINQ